MENNFDWLSILTLLLPILIFLGLSVIWEMKFVISAKEFSLFLPITRLFLTVFLMMDIYKMFTVTDVGFIFGISAVLLVMAYWIMLRIFRFKLLDWKKLYLFEADCYGYYWLSGDLTEGKVKFRALVENVSHPQDYKGRVFLVRIKKICLFDFFPVRLEAES
jgi:CDP-diglyceride synthetase